MELKTDIDKWRNAVINSYVDMKQNASVQANTSADLSKILFWQNKDGKLIVIFLDMDTLELANVIEKAKTVCGEPEYLMFCSDAYMKIAPGDTDISSLKRGELSESFKANDAKVVECLLFSFVSLDVIEVGTMPYSYEASMGEIVFGVNIDEIEFAPAASGVVPEALMIAFSP